MKLPLNNRIRAEYIVPKEMIERSHISDGLVEHLNKQLMARIADEILMAKPDIVEHSTVKFDDKNPRAQEYHILTGEVFVFTKDELTDLISRIQIETSTQIKEQITIVDNWKQERVYSELEVFLNEVKDKIDSFEYTVNQNCYISEYIDEWFKQFKNK